MIKIYLKNELDTNIKEIKKFQPGSWINIIAPTNDELKEIAKELNINQKFLECVIDEEERARLEVEDDLKLVIIDIPSFEKHTSYNLSVTIPLVMLQVRDEYILTLCSKETTLFDDFIENRVKTFFTNKKSRFTLQLMNKAISTFIKDLKIINEETNKSEKSLKKSTNNNDLLKLMHLQKSLVYFSTSLKSNDAVLDKLQKNNLIPIYEEDLDLLDDAVIENKQAIEMAVIYSGILSSTIEIFGTIISNNLNIIMKFLAGCTIVISIPTMIASFIGMNVPLGFLNNSVLAFPILILISLILSIIIAIILKKKNML